MAKGLLRKALHGAAKSGSDLVGKHIEELRAKRFADYQFDQEKEMFGMQEEATLKRDNRLHSQTVERDEAGREFTTARDTTEHGRVVERENASRAHQDASREDEQEHRTKEQQRAFERQVQSSLFDYGLRKENNREVSEANAALQRDKQQFDVYMKIMDHGLEMNAEAAQAAREADVIDVKEVTYTVDNENGMPMETKQTIGIFPDGSVGLFDPGAGEFLTRTERLSRDEQAAYQMDSQETIKMLAEGSKKERREEIAGWIERYPGRVPVDLPKLPPDVQEQFYAAMTGSKVGAVGGPNEDDDDVSRGGRDNLRNLFGGGGQQSADSLLNKYRTPDASERARRTGGSLTSQSPGPGQSASLPVRGLLQQARQGVQ